MKARSFYGGRVRETFGSAGFRRYRFANLRTAATLSRLAMSNDDLELNLRDLTHGTIFCFQVQPHQRSRPSLQHLCTLAFAPRNSLQPRAYRTELLETLASISDNPNLHHLVTATWVSLRDGQDMMGEIQRRWRVRLKNSPHIRR